MGIHKKRIEIRVPFLYNGYIKRVFGYMGNTGTKTNKPLSAVVSDFIHGLLENWNVPKPGEYTTLREFMFYCLGITGVCGFTFICSDTVAFSATYLCGSIFEISMMDFTVITFISLAVKYATLYVESVSMTIFENLGHLTRDKAKKAILAYAACIVVGTAFYFIPSKPFETIIKGLPQLVANILVVTGIGGPVNWYLRYKFCSKYGRYKPFLVAYGIPIAIVTSIIPFVPTSLPYTTRLVVLHLLFTVRGRFSAVYYDNPKAIVALITPNSVERQKYYSIGAIFLGGLRSIFRIIFPIMIRWTGGYLSIRSYQIFIPILCVFSFSMAFLMIGVKERVAANRDTAHTVEFGKSAKTLLKNKYLWIVNIAAVFGLWNAIADNVINYTLVYSLRIEWIVGIASIAGVTSALGNLTMPMLVKRFEKRSIIIVMRSIWALVTAGYLLGLLQGNNVFILLFFIFLRSAISAGCNGITDGLNADILDYHQWKTGERADNMIGVFSWFTTPVSTVLGLVSPALLKIYGLTSDWDVLFDSAVFTNVMQVYIYLGIVGLIVSTVPFIWYDLTREKHDRCVAEIAERETAANTEPAPLLPADAEGGAEG